MPIPSDYQEICQMLLEATRERRVKWLDKGTSVTVQLPSFNLELWSGQDERTDTVFVAVGLREKDSQKLFDNWYIEEGDVDYHLLNDLWTSARRQAKGVPQKLDTLRDLLRSGGEIGDDDVPF